MSESDIVQVKLIHIYKQNIETIDEGWDPVKTLFVSDRVQKKFEDVHASCLVKGRFMYYYQKIHEKDENAVGSYSL